MHMLSMDIEPCPHVITYVLLKGQSSRCSCPVEGGARILGVRIREVLLYFVQNVLTSSKEEPSVCVCVC